MDPDEVQLPDEHVGRDDLPLRGIFVRLRFPERILECPEPPLVRMLRGDGQKSQVDGHTGRNARLGEGAFADDGEE